MANPAFIEGSIRRRKQPAEALTGQDTLDPTSQYNIHNATLPTLADQDVAQTQCDDLGNTLISFGDPAQIAILLKGLKDPYHDKEIIDESSAPATTVITAYLGTATVYTKTISVSGTTTTIEVV